MIRKDLIIAILLTFCLTVTLFTILSTMGQVPEYDIWLDFNDDGKIDMRDIGVVARAFGANGQPINKTFVLLQLQTVVTELQGNFEVRVPQRNIISIPAAAFSPENRIGGDFYGQNQGISLVNYDDSQAVYFHAPVQLPQGVNITRVYSFWYDNGTRSVGLYLSKCNLTAYRVDMATLESPLQSSPGAGSSNTNIIDEPIIDNYSYYYLTVLLPPQPRPKFTDYAFYYAIIEYEYPE